MMKRTYSLLLICALASWNIPDVSAQTAGSTTEPKSHIVLGGTSGVPGESVVVPLYLNPPEGVSIAHLRVEVTFVSVNLKYNKTEQGIAAEMADTKVAATTSEGKNEQDLATTTVSVNIDSRQPDQALPPGLLAYIMLTIDAKGRPATIKLRNKVEATELHTGKPLPQVSAADSEVTVVAPGSEPAVICFFFTH